MKFQFDHTYSMDQDFAFRKKLGKAGFFTNSEECVHPGAHHCRFIHFFHKKVYAYLEFVHIGKGGKREYKPGLSFSAKGSLEKYGNTAAAKKMNLHVHHRNYDWKEGDTERRPGWNFGSFKGVKSNIHMWLTEYESRAPGKKRKRKLSVPEHRNGAYEIASMDIVLSTSDLKLYTSLLGKPKNGEWNMHGTLRLRFTKGKQSRINSVTIRTDNLKKMIQKYEWDELTVYDNQPAVRIKNPDKKMWDVILIQGK